MVAQGCGRKRIGIPEQAVGDKRAALAAGFGRVASGRPCRTFVAVGVILLRSGTLHFATQVAAKYRYAVGSCRLAAVAPAVAQSAQLPGAAIAVAARGQTDKTAIGATTPGAPSAWVSLRERETAS